jgi:DMSO/TMAO reductase YedYZ molybdopterin-dependent catalytic subunit
VRYIEIISMINLIAMLVFTALASSCGQVTSNSSAEIISQSTRTTASTSEFVVQSTETTTVLTETTSESTATNASDRITADNISQYRLTIDGLVDSPLTLTYEAVLQYPAVTENVTLICPGVWGERADWTGVPVSTLLTKAGIQSDAKQVEFSSSDGYTIVLDLADAGKPGMFLAYQRNGQTLTQEEGYPVRLVAESMDGYNWVRWITHIKVTSSPPGT